MSTSNNQPVNMSSSTQHEQGSTVSQQNAEHSRNDANASPSAILSAYDLRSEDFNSWLSTFSDNMATSATVWPSRGGQNHVSGEGPSNGLTIASAPQMSHPGDDWDTFQDYGDTPMLATNLYRTLPVSSWNISFLPSQTVSSDPPCDLQNHLIYDLQANNIFQPVDNGTVAPLFQPYRDIASYNPPVVASYQQPAIEITNAAGKTKEVRNRLTYSSSTPTISAGDSRTISNQDSGTLTLGDANPSGKRRLDDTEEIVSYAQLPSGVLC
jgi:hypothetical protein